MTNTNQDFTPAKSWPKRLEPVTIGFLVFAFICFGFAFFCPLDAPPATWVKDIMAKF